MKKLLLLISLFSLQINFAQNTYPTTGNAYYDTSLKIGKQEAPSSTIGEINRLSIQPYGHTGGPWNFKSRDNTSLAFLDIDYGITGSALTITSDKNVGIGISNPTYKLEVNGFSLFRGGILSSISDDAGGNFKLQNPSKTSAGIANIWSIYNMTGAYGNSLQFWAYDYLGCAGGGLCTNRFRIMDNGNVGIGTTNPTSKLTVAGNINSREVKVTVDAGADFVFENNYNLPSLDSVDKYIKENKHLPEIASAEAMKKDGINLSEMNIKLLQKIEELTLYMIEMKKENERQIEKQNEEIKGLKIKLYSK